MKKHSIGSRLISLLLVLAMAVSFVPASVFAAEIGDMATGTVAGDTGLKDNIDTQDTISWPVKIYDFLNDGMLFEYANANATNVFDDELGGAYGGGTPAPHFKGASTVIGTDYTVNWGYNESAYYTWLNKYSAFKYPALVEAVNFESPSHLHLVPDNTYADMKPWIMSDYAGDNVITGYSPDAVRYAVVAYRTSGLEDGEAKLNLGWETNLVGSRTYEGYDSVNYDYRGSVGLVANSTEWNYVVIDMKAGTLEDNWNSITTVYRVIADFQMNEPTDSVDISHVAYFDTEFEAEQFGMDCVAFDNDPGEFLNAHTEYTDSRQVEYTKPTTGNNGMDFSVSDNTSGGYKVDTYQDWTTAETGYYIGTMNGVSVTEVENGERSYVRVSNKDNSTNGNIKVWDYSGGGSFTHVTIVYKTTNFTADDLISFYVKYNGYYGGGANMYSNGIAGVGSGAKITLAKSEGEWTYVTYAFSQIDNGDPDYVAGSYYNTYGLYLPACMTGKNMSLDIAMVNFFNSASEATTYGVEGARYMNKETYTVSGSYQTSNKEWNGGNNVAFSMLFANQGTPWGSVRGGESETENGYFSYEIGILPSSHSSATTLNGDRATAKSKGYPVSDTTYQISTAYDTPYDMQDLDFGYKLFNTFESGIMTAGLLESSLTTVTSSDGTAYRVPDYKESTIEYIAYLLRDALCIGETDSKGYYNYNFVQGTANGEQYGCAADGTPYDLASALRAQLGIVLPENGNCSYTASGSTVKAVGDYAEMTNADKAGLIGSFDACKGNIDTFVDAAYYLLMNLYVGDSYNQAQDEYNYLVLSSATLDDGKTGYVFDGGFTTGDADSTANTDEYRTSSQSAVVYDKQKGIIYQSSSASKDKVYFGSDSTTTRFPFLPVTDAEGVYAGETKSPYFLDDGYGVMGVTEEGATFVNRNYNFALASNGEFVYHAEDDLFFNFEGDDDVYLFINGELVLDIGGAHSITDVSMQVNDYVDWAKTVLAEESADAASHTDAEVARANKLNLVDGESYTFDFYYMERHGWGSNCRIASNIRVTDPQLKTDKTAYQGDDEIPYSGAVNGDLLVEYSFAMTNEGNNKLYNLDFKDGNIGVTLDHNLGLVTHGQPTIKEVTLTTAGDIMISGFNGAVNMDGTGAQYTEDNTLTLKNVAAGTHTLVMYQMNTDPYQDATATITYGGTTETTAIAGVRVTDANGNTLDYSDLVITIDGYLAEDMTEANKFDTITIQVSSKEQLTDFLKTLKDPNDKTETSTTTGLFGGNGLWRHGTVTVRGMYYRLTDAQKAAGKFDNTVYTYATSNPTSTTVIKGEDIHRVYVTGAPTYYQWAGHNLFISDDKFEKDVIEAANTTGNQLTEYASFFEAVGNGGNYSTAFCDKYGVTTTYSEVTKVSGGYQVNYPMAGTYAYYVLMYLEGTDISDLTADAAKGKYALVRVTVYVADVEDSVYVLDYGLATEDLGADGELFKNDKLFGGESSHDASLMGIADTEPSYLNGSNRISFSGLGESERIKIMESDGYFSTNLIIPKEITYDSATKTYSLTEAGTNTITVKTPAEWDSVNLYYWYDGGTNNSWPGTAMKKVMSGVFTLDIPGDVGKLIINNGTDQTANILITPGLAATITVNNNWSYTIDTAIENVTVTASVPTDWQNVNLYYWYEGSNTNNGWPGTPMTKGSDGQYSLSIPGNVSKVIINNNAGEQTVDITLDAGKDCVITVGNQTSTDNNTKYFAASVDYTDRTCVIHAKVPETWTTVKLHYWSNSSKPVTWPGTAMTDTDGDGWYDLEIPADMTYAIVSNGSDQTIDLPMRPDLETWITVNTETVTVGEATRHTADVDYRAAITFTPTDFMDELYNIWMAVSVHDVNETPTALSDGTIDINNEVQMYKKITVLPASVVYYEDDFPAIDYLDVNGDKIVDTKNEFTTLGTGSGNLTQSVDQEENYGYDHVYQDNKDMSGESLHKFTITDANRFAHFQFKGTGFELISRTQAEEYATIMVTVINTATNETVQAIPVINQFDNGNNGGDEEIYQVPVIRVEDLAYGTYDVYINGAPDRNYELICYTCGGDGKVTEDGEEVACSECDGSGKVEKSPCTTCKGDKKVTVDCSECNGGKLTDGSDCKTCSGTGKVTKTCSECFGVGAIYPVLPSYFYLDGLRIYEPLGDLDDTKNDYDDTYYDVDEKNATFAELRDLIVNGYVASVVHDGSAVYTSTGTTTWTEDLMDDGYTVGVIEANQVSSVEEYLTEGPNNEVYINGSVADAALVFYVKESSASQNHNLQIAVHGVDEGLFVGSESVPMNAVIEYGVKNGDSYAWSPLVTVTSGTEQYYTIPYETCPYSETHGYQVAVRVRSGMASFTSLKYNGLLINQVIGDSTSLRYINGILSDTDTGAAVDSANYVDFQSVAYQMTATTLTQAPEATEPEATEPEATEPEATEPEATEPEATEPEATEPGDEEQNTDNRYDLLWKSLMDTIAHLMSLVVRRR